MQLFAWFRRLIEGKPETAWLIPTYRGRDYRPIPGHAREAFLAKYPNATFRWASAEDLVEGDEP